MPCPSDAPKLMLPVRRSSTRKMMSTSTPFSAGFTSGGGIGCWKKSEVGDVLVRADQPLAAEDVPRQHHDRLADDPLVGDVVAHDHDLVDRGRLALADGPLRSMDGAPSGPVRRISSGVTEA